MRAPIVKICCNHTGIVGGNPCASLPEDDFIREKLTSTIGQLFPANSTYDIQILIIPVEENEVIEENIETILGPEEVSAILGDSTVEDGSDEH